MEIRHRIDSRLDNLLYKEKRDFYRTACPPCAEKCEGKKTLPRSVLFSLDGNESLKRHRRLRGADKNLKKDTSLADNRARFSRFFLEVDVVERYKNEVKRSKKITVGSPNTLHTRNLMRASLLTN